MRRIPIREVHESLAAGIDRSTKRIIPYMLAFVRKQKRLTKLPVYGRDHFVMPGAVLMRVTIIVEEEPQHVGGRK